MPIIQAELKFYKSASVNDTSSNGGRMSVNQITSGAASNLFPAVGQSERLDGSTKYRKLFAKVANDADLTLTAPNVYLDKNTPGGDLISFFPATQTDVQSAITGSERQYGGGLLDSNVSGGATTCDIAVEDGAALRFFNGDKVRITNKVDVDSAGDEEFVTISGVPTVLVNVVTIVFSPALSTGYSTANTRVQSVYNPADVEVVIDNLQVTSGTGGDFNPAYLFGDNISSVEQVWTLTFTSATAFDVVGDTLGAVASGSTGAGVSPNNPSFTKPYFVMQSTGFSGTFATGNTIVFETHPASVPLWVKRVVPAATAVQAANTATIVLDGETA